MKRIWKRSARLTTTTTLALLPAIACAQSIVAKPSDQPVDAQASSQPSEIIVTAEKREQSALTVPGSVTALRQEDLLNRGATTIRDFSAFVPGLNVGSGIGGNSIIIRGINTGALDSSAASGVIIDGSPIGSSSTFVSGASVAFDLDPSDIERVEVLRGPQGTLYGASTLGGLVSYVTRRADLEEFHVTASGEGAGTHDGGASYIARGAVDVPLVKDTLGIRASGFYDRDGGYIDDSIRNQQDINRAKRYGGRIDLYFKPTDSISVDIWGALQKTDHNAESFILTDSNGHPTGGSLNYNSIIYPSSNQNYKIVHGEIKADLGFAQLSYVGSYQHQNQTILVDYTHNSLAGTLGLIGQLGLGPMFPSPGATSTTLGLKLDKNTQEVRLASNSSGPLTWIVGGYYTYEKGFQSQDVQGRDVSSAVVPSLDPALLIFLESRYQEYAGFGNASYAITPRLTVTGGFRIGQDRQRYQQILSGSSLPGLNTVLSSIYGPGGELHTTAPARSVETVKTYLADAKYQFSPRAQAYFRFATGFRPGGPNIQALGSPATFGPDKVDSYEVGFKGETSDRSASIELAAFYVDWKNIQLSASSGGISYRKNGGRASSKGIEATARVSPINGLSLSGVLAYTVAHLDEAVPTIGAEDGDALPLTPRWTATATADYIFPIAPDVKGVLGGVLRLVSDRHVSFPGYLAIPDLRLDGYSTADLRAGLRFSQFEVDAFARNVTDERAELSGRTISGVNEVLIARPRTIGMMASIHY